MNPAIIVFKTGKIYEFDMVLNLLDEAGIPTFTQNQTSSGLRLATPATLTGDAGNWWTIGVPESFGEQAREIIASLPFDEKTEPEVWDFAHTNYRTRLKWFYRVIAVIWLLTLLYLFVGGFF